LIGLEQYLNDPQRTLLCLGPLSTNILDVAFEMSRAQDFPLILVASRRQIEAREFGGGYVNGWDTESFVKHCRSAETGIIYLERDHGGPWQGPYEVDRNLNVEESMAVAKKSYEVDIDSGVQIIHIDPTMPIQNENLQFSTILQRLFELYGHVVEYAARKNKKIAIEIGTEEQSGSPPDEASFDSFLMQVQQFCTKNKFEMPLFVVLQTGTKVLENRNAGVFETGDAELVSRTIQRIRKSAEMAGKYGVKIKEHNTDYVSLNNLTLRPSLGIRASNVAPEFGYLETQALVHLLKQFAPNRDFEDFIQIVNESGKWKKWMAPDSKANPEEKALIAGHYCYTDPRIVEIKERLNRNLQKQRIDLNVFLQRNIRTAFYKYAQAFGLI
jgi:tagatose-1,6-bisphosphate aldolase non-catalytic subunit AgaZ/GatZ